MLNNHLSFLLALSLVASVLFPSCGPGSTADSTLSIRGSDTEVNLVLEQAETYMSINPNISISVTGGGSGSGIAALINGKTDIANSSREMKEAELDLARQREVEPVAIAFAIDAIVMATNAQNPVDSITLEQLGKIYSGEFTNWSEVGGADMPISLYGRQSNSGTFIYFRDNIIRGEYSPDMKQMNGTAQIVEGIKNDVAGIGYVGIGYVINQAGNKVDDLQVLQIKTTPDSPAVSPLEENVVEDGRYQITRPLYQYTDGIPTGNARAFIQFELSEQGQEIVKRNGYFPLGKTYQAQNEEIGIYDQQ